MRGNMGRELFMVIDLLLCQAWQLLYRPFRMPDGDTVFGKTRCPEQHVMIVPHDDNSSCITVSQPPGTHFIGLPYPLRFLAVGRIRGREHDRVMRDQKTTNNVCHTFYLFGEAE